jgi:lipoyl(octanoyl) transferase
MKQEVIFRNLSLMGYKPAWDLQEELLKKNLDLKFNSCRSPVGNGQSAMGNAFDNEASAMVSSLQSTLKSENSQFPNPKLKSLREESYGQNLESRTVHYLLFCEHHPVYTLGKTGKKENILISEEEMGIKGIEYYQTNRGGDITFHGPGQLVGYPILDLEKFYTDIGKYLRSLEEVIILALAGYGIKGERSPGETGVWIEPGVKGRERKICAMGVRCSRWITMHGFAFNVNTDLRYFDFIVPCGIRDKKVTSLQKELGYTVCMEEVNENVKDAFELVFDCNLVSADLLV